MKWRLYICSDCDTDDGAVIVQVPDDAEFDWWSAIHHCPGCESYGSMNPKGDVEVNGAALRHLRMREREEAGRSTT